MISETKPKDIPSRLIFLNYTISKNENNQKRIQLINKIVTEGKLKNNNIYKSIGTIGDLKCIQLSKDSIEINHINIENPLSKIIEYVNDSLIFERKKIELTTAPISLRLQLNNKTKYIVISEILDSLQNSRPLITTKLD